MRDLVFFVPFGAMLLMSLRYLHAGTMLWVWTALGVPANYMYGFMSGLPLNKIVVFATIISLFADQGRRKPYLDSHIVLLVLFVLQGAIALTFGLSDQVRPYEIFDKMLKISALCIFMTMARRGRVQIHAMVIIICLGVGIHAIIEGLKYVASGGAHVVSIESLGFGDNNYLALFTVMIMPMLNYLIQYSASLLLRLIFRGMMALCIVSIIATASRGGLIGLFILALFLTWRSQRKLLNLLLICVISFGILSFAPDRWLQRMETIGAADQDSSFMSRVSSWKLHTIVALDRPLIGGGYSPLEDGRVATQYHLKFDMLDFIPSPALNGPLAAHSSFFQVLGDVGFPGLFLFLALVFNGFRNVMRISRRAWNDPSLAWANELAKSYCLALIVFLVSGALLSASYLELLYVILAQLSVLRRHAEEYGMPVLVEAVKVETISHGAIGTDHIGWRQRRARAL